MYFVPLLGFRFVHQYKNHGAVTNVLLLFKMCLNCGTNFYSTRVSDSFSDFPDADC